MNDKLRQLNDRLVLATKAGGVGIWDYDVINNKLIWDDQMYKLYGITPDMFSGAYDAWRSGLHPEDTQRGDDEIQMALRGEKEFDTEFRVLWPNGSIRYIRAIAIVQRDPSGKPLRMVGTNWDITERRQTEELLKKNSEKFMKLTENVPGLIFQFTRRTDGTYFVPIASKAIKDIFGCSPEDVANDFSPIAKVLHSEDSARVIDDIETSANNLTLFTCEFRVQIPGKPVQWVYCNSKPEKMDDGSITWYGYNYDITERKMIEKALADKIYELEKMNSLMVDRELKMVELKDKVESLEKQNSV